MRILFPSVFFMVICAAFIASAETPPVKSRPVDNPPPKPQAAKRIDIPPEKPAGAIEGYTVGEEMEDATLPIADPPPPEPEPKNKAAPKDEKPEDAAEDDNEKNRWLPKPQGMIQVLDKTKTRSVSVKSEVGKEYTVGGIVYTVKKCFIAGDDYAPGSAALLEISELQNDKSKKKLFYGWMFSSEPALTYIENPVYDVVLSGCSD